MRTTLDIDERLLSEAIRLTNIKTKREVIRFSLEELIRRRKIEKLITNLGKFPLKLTMKDLEKMRKGE